MSSDPLWVGGDSAPILETPQLRLYLKLTVNYVSRGRFFHVTLVLYSLTHTISSNFSPWCPT